MSKKPEGDEKNPDLEIIQTYYSHLSRLYTSGYVGFFTVLLAIIVFVYSNNDSLPKIVVVTVGLLLLISDGIIGVRTLAYSQRLIWVLKPSSPTKRGWRSLTADTVSVLHRAGAVSTNSQ